MAAMTGPVGSFCARTTFWEWDGNKQACARVVLSPTYARVGPVSLSFLGDGLACKRRVSCAGGGAQYVFVVRTD